MSVITGKYDLNTHEGRIGTVEVYNSGLMTVIECFCDIKTPEILRLGANSGGKTIPVGVLMPERGGLYIKKSYSSSSLHALGIEGVDYFTLIGLEDKTKPPEAPQTDAVPDAGIPKENLPEPAEAAAPSSVQPGPEVKVPMSPRRKAVPEPTPEIQQPKNMVDWRNADSPEAYKFAELIPEEYRGIRDAMVSDKGETVLFAVPLTNEPFAAMPVFLYGEPSSIGGADYVVFKIKNGEFIRRRNT